jgi:hypothetical protein
MTPNLLSTTEIVGLLTAPVGVMIGIPPGRYQAAAHRFERTFPFLLDHGINRGRQADVVARLKVRRDVRNSQAVEPDEFFPRIHPGKATAHRPRLPNRGG